MLCPARRPHTEPRCPIAAQCRAAQRARWEKDATAFEPVATAACEYAELCLECDDPKERYAAKMYLSGIVHKSERAFGDHEKHAALRSCLARLEEAVAPSQAGQAAK